MSRQYLKELQERAQKLLQVSSEEEEDVNAYTATDRNARSPARIDLDDFLFEDHSDQNSELDPPRGTDVQLLKKCINLTNENNSLKLLLQKKDLQIKDLEYRLLNLNSKESPATRQNEQRQDEKRMIENNASNTSELKALALQLSQLQREIAEMKMEKNSVKRQFEELKREREEFRREKEDFNRQICQRNRERSPQIDIRNDYTIKTAKMQQRRVSPQLTQEYQARIRRLQGMLREERSKVTRLCEFLNAEIPGLRDKLVQTTAKLDAKVSKYLLRDYDY